MTDRPHPMPRAADRQASSLWRWVPVAVLAAAFASGYALGLHRYVSLNALAEHRDTLRQFVDANLPLALVLFMLLYIAVVVASLPGAAVMSIAGGFLFGWPISIPATLIAAIIGSTIVFQVVKTSLGAVMAERAGPLVQRLSRGFAENAFSLLLFLRLAPVVPFCAVNAVSGLCRVPLRTFVLATVIGIIPASVAFALVGSGLDGVIAEQTALYKACLAATPLGPCKLALHPRALLTPELVTGFACLGVVALIPVAARLWKARQR